MVTKTNDKLYSASIAANVGENTANNEFDSANVSANADGSILERAEYIQTSIAAIKAIAGALTDTADHTASTATIMKLLRWLDQNIGGFDGGADPQGSIFRALGVDTTNSIKALIDDVESKVDGLEAPVGSLSDVADESVGTSTIMNLLRGILARNIAKEVYKTVAFDGGAGSGGIGTVALFTVTGAVKIKITAICTETLVGAATLECGYAGTTNGIIAQIANATALIAGEIWYDATPTTLVDTVANGELQFILGNGQDLYLTVGSANITDGTIAFKIVWEPLTSNGAVVAA